VARKRVVVVDVFDHDGTLKTTKHAKGTKDNG